MAAVMLLAGCHRDMRDQPRYETLEASSLFANGQASRPVPKGTVPRGRLTHDESLETGRDGADFVKQIPVHIERKLMVRGQERFNIYCSPCHGRTGAGDGMVVRRGFRRPPALFAERLRNSPAGHFFDVITRGFGAMPAYGAHVSAEDRWAIVAYVRALQLSHTASLEDVPLDERSALEASL